jgi:signal transduction histidine kinase
MLERYQARRTGGASDDEIANALALAAEIDQAVDFLAWELRPAALDDLGLEAALPRYVSEWSKHVDIAAEFRSGGTRSGQLSRDAEVAFYRVAQEALNNVVKHAHASRVDVILEHRDDTVTLVIEDDGVGFDTTDQQTTEKGMGIVGMRERASLIGAALQVESAPGKGATVFLRCAVQRLAAQAGPPS